MTKVLKTALTAIATVTVNGVPANRLDIMKALSENDVKINNSIELEIDQVLALAKQANAIEFDIEISEKEIIYKFMIEDEKSSLIKELIDKEQNQELFEILKSASEKTSDQVVFKQKRDGVEIILVPPVGTTEKSEVEVVTKKKISDVAVGVVTIVGGVGSLIAGAFALAKAFSD